jgi:hypothetical protein
LICKKLYIAILALFLLFVFLLPDVVKFIHHHDVEQLNSNKKFVGKSVSKATVKCIICKFEFVNYILKNTPRNFLSQVLSPLLISGQTLAACKLFITSYNLRAPPFPLS